MRRNSDRLLVSRIANPDLVYINRFQTACFFTAKKSTIVIQNKLLNE